MAKKIATHTAPSATGTTTTIISVTGKGLGFIPNPDPTKEDIRIEEGFLNTALHGDTVEVRLLPPKFKDAPPGAEVVKIVARARTTYVGAVEEENGSFFLVPDNKKMYKDILLPRAKLRDAKAGDKVLVRMDEWHDSKKSPVGEVMEIIGRKGEHETEIASILKERGFENTFSPAVEEESKAIKKEYETTGAWEREIAKRRDMRTSVTCTIDPVDAKDFDDAISIMPIGQNTYEVGVHIADVSHFVREGTPLDTEAAKRNFSLYLVDRTIPMLPEILSNDLCSLNPKEDKLTFSAVFKMEKKANGTWDITDRWFGRTAINSNRRFTYEQVQEILDAGAGDYATELLLLRDITRQLRDEKTRKGAIDFEQDEVKFVLDSNGRPIKVYKKQRVEAHKLVEDMMLLANRSVAEYMFDTHKGAKQRPFIFRIHDIPDREKIGNLSLYIRALGFDLAVNKNGDVTGPALQKLFTDIAGTPYEPLIKTAAVRSMAKAIYSTKNIGHFGLAFDYYTHFTSPIRRYPDLLVHRLLEKKIKGEPIASDELAQYEKKAVAASEKEISVSEAERASIKYKQVEYMSERVGQTFEGIIAGVTEWGIYLEEKETRAEGFVRLRDLGDDFYELDSKNYCIVGTRTKKKFSLGDPVHFKISAVDLDKKTIDAALV